MNNTANKLKTLTELANDRLGSKIFEVKVEDGELTIQNTACRYEGNDLTMKQKTGYPTFERELSISGQSPIICFTPNDAVDALVNNYCPED